MNTILLQKILDILREGLAHVGDFFKDLFVSDPQDGQVIAYDAETGHWVNKDATEVELNLTNTFAAQPIATLTDGGENVPMKSLVCEIVPKETGTGTKSPSNHYVISGWDSIPVKHCGVNIWDEETELGSIDANGNLISGNTTLRSKNAIKVNPNTTYYFLGAGYNGYIYGYDADGNFSGWGSGQINNNTLTTGATTYYIRFRMASAYGTTYLNNMGIMSDTSQTTYVAYPATTTTIDLPSTVYGGEVDVVSGNGVSDTDVYTFTGLENWIFNDTNNYWYFSVASVARPKTSGESTTTENGIIAKMYDGGSRGLPRIYLSDNPSITSETDMTTIFTSGQKIAFKTLETTPISTTPTPIKTQGGTESIWSDTGDVSGEYYTKTAENVLALANITEDITSSVTKNTTDFSDILFKASKNNKVVSIEIYSASTSSALIGTFLSNLPKPAMNCKVLLANTTLGEDGIILGALKTTGELEITTTGAKTFSGIITYVEK